MHGALLPYEVCGEVHKQVGNLGFHSYIGCYQAKDGKWVLLSGTTNAIWRRLTRAISREDMASDPRFGLNDMVRFNNAKIINPLIKECISQRTSDEVVKMLQEARVP